MSDHTKASGTASVTSCGGRARLPLTLRLLLEMVSFDDAEDDLDSSSNTSDQTGDHIFS